MTGIILYTVKIHDQAEPGCRVQITQTDGWEEKPRTYVNKKLGIRELKTDLERVSYRGYMTLNPAKLEEGAMLIIEANKKRAADEIKRARRRMDAVVASAQEAAQAFNAEVTA